jgi:lipid-binding SYLF domain-containing protein
MITQMRDEILAWSRTRGIFVGISLEGAIVSQDKDANLDLYGKRVTPKGLLLKPGQKIPPEAKGFVDALDKLSPRNASDW